MRCVGLIGVMFGLGLGLAVAASDPPVILDLGPLVPTPGPTPEPATRRRLITTLTVQNAATGESVMSFEATDVADRGGGKVRTIGAARYSLSDDRPELQALRAKIMHEIRALEHDLLEYAEIAGPPKERHPLVGGGAGGGLSEDKPK